MKLSDTIENFILEIMGDNNSCDICRNELAVYFQCVPSQINYCLATRFTYEKGFRVDSRRGGGGYIHIERIEKSNDSYLNDVMKTLNEPLSFTRAKQIITYMESNNIITKNESDFLSTIMSDRALANPMNIQDTIRRNIMKETIVEIIKR